MGIADMMFEAERAEDLRIAVTLAFSRLSDEQLRLLATAYGYSSPDYMMRSWIRVVGTQQQRAEAAIRVAEEAGLGERTVGAIRDAWDRMDGATAGALLSAGAAMIAQNRVRILRAMPARLRAPALAAMAAAGAIGGLFLDPDSEGSNDDARALPLPGPDEVEGEAVDDLDDF